MITVVGGTKGGSGKSTVATNLTIMLTAAGHDVLLVDADDQETSTDFTNFREASRPGGAGYTCIALTGPAVRTGVQPSCLSWWVRRLRLTRFQAAVGPCGWGRS